MNKLTFYKTFFNWYISFIYELHAHACARHCSRSWYCEKQKEREKQRTTNNYIMTDCYNDGVAWLAIASLRSINMSNWTKVDLLATSQILSSSRKWPMMKRNMAVCSLCCYNVTRTIRRGMKNKKAIIVTGKSCLLQGTSLPDIENDSAVPGPSWTPPHSRHPRRPFPTLRYPALTLVFLCESIVRSRGAPWLGSDTVRGMVVRRRAGMSTEKVGAREGVATTPDQQRRPPIRSDDEIRRRSTSPFVEGARPFFVILSHQPCLFLVHSWFNIVFCVTILVWRYFLCDLIARFLSFLPWYIYSFI